MFPLWDSTFEKVMNYPANSRMYLYLLNNMFASNIRWDQAGPMSFSYSIRSHDGDWRQGSADEFGWEVHCPLLAKVVRGKKQGVLPASAGLLAVDPPNVVCTAIEARRVERRRPDSAADRNAGRARRRNRLAPLLRSDRLRDGDRSGGERSAGAGGSEGPTAIAFTMRPLE